MWMRFTTATILLFVLAVHTTAKLENFQGIFGPFNDPLKTIKTSLLNIRQSSATIPSSSPPPPKTLSTLTCLAASYTIHPLNSGKIQTMTPHSPHLTHLSSFLFNINRIPNTSGPGEDLAFIIAPSFSLIPLNNAGQYLGLTNSTIDGDPTNYILAVEFDTYMQKDFDLDNNHVGLNLNSIISTKSISLTTLGFELCPANKSNFFVSWVQYDGVKKVTEVYIAQQDDLTGPTPPRPDTPILSSYVDLRDVVNQSSYFGFSASTGIVRCSFRRRPYLCFYDGPRTRLFFSRRETFVAQLNTVLRWNLTVQYFIDGKESAHTTTVVAISLSIGVVSLLVLGVRLRYYCKMKGIMAKKSNLVRALRNLPATPTEFNFKKLKKATGNFDEKNKLGQEAYGVVYRGEIPEEIWRWR